MRYLDEPPDDVRLPGERPDPRGIDAAELVKLDLPPLRWIVPDILPEGTTVIASPPKIGKSCLIYQVVVETALGGELLGRRVTPGIRAVPRPRGWRPSRT